jgi:uncharacterized membrane protein YdbT with pleckstrin-like domain
MMRFLIVMLATIITVVIVRRLGWHPTKLWHVILLLLLAGIAWSFVGLPAYCVDWDQMGCMEYDFE